MKVIRMVAVAALFLGVLMFTPLGMVPVLFYGARYYPDRFAAEAEQGEPLVKAVYQYRGAIGLYPERAEDLVPTWLPAVPQGWTYRRSPGSRPSLYRHGAFHCSLTYYFPETDLEGFPPGVKDGWVLDQEGSTRFLRRSRYGPQPSRLSPEELELRRLGELRRRTERGDSGEALIDDFRALVSEYLALGRLDEAKSACRRCMAARPEERWCRLALAELGLRGGSTEGRDEFAAWAARKPSFSSYCDLSLLDQAHGREFEAIEAVREAVKLPLTVGDRGGFTPEFYAFQAAGLAYRLKQYAVAIAACDRWEEFVRSRGWGEKSYHAVRAAAALAAGDRERAVRDATLAVREDRASKTWAGDPRALLKAAETGDREFVYDPGAGRVGHLLFDDRVE